MIYYSILYCIEAVCDMHMIFYVRKSIYVESEELYIDAVFYPTSYLLSISNKFFKKRPQLSDFPGVYVGIPSQDRANLPIRKNILTKIGRLEHFLGCLSCLKEIDVRSDVGFEEKNSFDVWFIGIWSGSLETLRDSSWSCYGGMMLGFNLAVGELEAGRIWPLIWRLSNVAFRVSVSNTITLDEEDIFQCGRCRTQFSALTDFVLHKQEECGGEGLASGLHWGYTEVNVEAAVFWGRLC